MNSYDKLKKIQQNVNAPVLSVALTYLLDIGFKAATQITDEMINEAKGNDLMTKGFEELVMKTAREIAQTVNLTDVYVFCQAEDIFDTRYNASKLPRYTLEDMIKASLSPMSIMDVEYNLDTKEGIKRVCEKYDCDAEDLELLGITIPEDYWEGDE